MSDNRASEIHPETFNQAILTTRRHYPAWDAVRGEPLLELTRARREVLAAGADLEDKRAQYEAQRKLFEGQWAELREREALLRRSFLRFDEFVRENRDKRERAARKIHDEKERQKIREAEVRTCLEEIFWDLLFLWGFIRLVVLL